MAAKNTASSAYILDLAGTQFLARTLIDENGRTLDRVALARSLVALPIRVQELVRDSVGDEVRVDVVSLVRLLRVRLLQHRTCSIPILDPFVHRID